MSEPGEAVAGSCRDLDGDLEIVGRVAHASNHTFFCELRGTGGVRHVVYKPVSGERPLWDFTTGTLADREYAAWLVSDALGWDLVPATVLRDGPHGLGMVQQWIDVDTTVEPVDVVRPGTAPEGYRHVLDAEDAAGRPVELVHEDSVPLRRMAAFDVLVNNTDRKGGHVLPVAGVPGARDGHQDGHRHGIDHGVCFHEDDKLRTVLWGFAGEPVGAGILADIDRVVADSALLGLLSEHLTAVEVQRFVDRGRRLCAAGLLPEMAGGWPPIPWPPF